MIIDYHIGSDKFKKFSKAVRELFEPESFSGELLEYDSFIVFFLHPDRIRFGFLSHHPKYHDVPYQSDWGWVSREEFFEWLPENLRDFFIFNLDLLMEE